MLRKWFIVTLSSLLYLLGHSQELTYELKEELRRTNPYFEVWEGRIPLRLEPKQRYPRNFEEAKHWLREASNCSVLADILKEEMKKPYEVWAPFYCRAIFLARGVYEKFGEFLYGWIQPYAYWGRYGDVVMPIDEFFKEYTQWISDPERSGIDPFNQLYLTFLTAARIAAGEEGVLQKFPVSRPATTSPLKTLFWSLRALKKWRQAMEVAEEMLSLYPPMEGIFEWWIECATKVYRKGELPTKFLLVQNLKVHQTGPEAMSAQKVKGVALLLRFKNGHHYVSTSRLSLFLGWKVEREGKEIFLKTQDREVKLTVGGRTAYVNGFKVRLNGFVWEEGKEVWLPLQFVAMIAKGKLKREKGKGFIQMMLPE
jgi:hypothetical protein